MAVSFSKLGSYGRLGNSLFQAACTIAHAKRHGDEFIFPYSWKYREVFNISPSHYAHVMRPLHTYEEPYFHYAAIPYTPNTDLFGYFQSEKYFKDFESDIRVNFEPKINIESRPGVTSVHVRRGDYLTLPKHHPVLDMKYYEAAMEEIGSNRFLVISDDVPWCKNHFVGNMFEFSDGTDELLDFVLQVGCEHNIIANSSFSWWSAWLNANPHKRVVAPSRWFGHALSGHNTEDLYPAGWTKL